MQRQARSQGNETNDFLCMLGNDRHYWSTVGNRSWPAAYLVDKQGRNGQVYSGETYIGDARAVRIVTDLDAPLAE